MAYLMLDVGGTGIKAGVVSKNGEAVKETFCRFDARAKEKKEVIFSNLADVLVELVALMEKLSKLNGKNEPVFIDGVGMAFPGPFDYQNGISLMHGIGKYDDIYGISVEQAVRNSFAETKSGYVISQDCPFVFLHDVEAFAIGECHFGICSEEKDKRVMCVCIGTGAGSAFLENKLTVKLGNGVPENGWIYNTPFKESIIDDYISARGLSSLAREQTGSSINGRELYEMAKNGNTNAVEIFNKFGENINAALLPFIKSFAPDCVVLGGQISGSFEYFGSELKNECEKRNIHIYAVQDTSKRVFQGLYKAVKEKKN